MIQYTETRMRCPFLTGKYMLSCTANKEVYIPSFLELKEYCRSGRHKMCPFYSRIENEGQVVITDDT